ncbi:MAG TPA: class I SAM-dependent methyltransferase [Candidatus Binatia bacterium]|nr:class I SAM-dependent methyltransferase [Candidatus Binatia bacterium]
MTLPFPEPSLRGYIAQSPSLQMTTQPIDQRSAAERNTAIYDRFWEDAPDYVRYHPGARHRRRLILRAVGRSPYASVLDVGCGDGTLLRQVRRARPDVAVWAGADLSASQVERNKSRLADVDFYALDIQKAALERTFDLVLCSEVIEHLDDPVAAIRHLASMLNPGGRLVLTCPTGTVYATEKHFGHVRHPTRGWLEQETVAAGLRVASLQCWGWPLYGLLKWATNVNANWALRNFADGRYSTAAKLVSSSLYWTNFLNKPDDARGCQLIGVFEKAP